MDCTSEGCRNRADKETSGEGVSRSEPVAGWSSDQSNKERSNKGDDVGVGDINLTELQIFGDCNAQLLVELEGTQASLEGDKRHTNGGNAYQDQNATRKPNHENVNTRP